MSHFHDPEDGFVFLEEDEWHSDGQLSASSVVHNPKSTKKKRAAVDATVILHPHSNIITAKLLKKIDLLREASELVTTSAEVARYVQDIVVFLRLSRAVAGGISAKANNQLVRFAK